MGLDTDLFIQLAYAIGVGLLIGLERAIGQSLTKKSSDPDGEEEDGATKSKEGEGPGEETEAGSSPESPLWLRDDLLGPRTFSVISLLGFGAAIAAERYEWVAPVALASVSLLVISMYKRVPFPEIGITTEAAAIATCALGMLCRFHPEIAAVLALVITVVLSSKRFTHGIIRRARRVELTDTLKFLVVILIVLPLLPNRALDPYGAFNPYKVGFLVVLISGISFVGYFLTRILGARKGLGLTGIVGGLTSSTAVTAAMATEAKEQPAFRAICGFSTVAANATMFARVLVVVALLDRPLAYQLAWPVGVMCGVAIICSIVLWFVAAGSKDERKSSSVKLKNPFSLGPAIKFAAFFVGILFVAKLANLYFGDSGLYAAAALSGLADVDAITLSIAEQSSQHTLERDVGAVAITIAVVSNSVVKTGIAIYSGGWKFGRLVGICLGLATAAGLAVAFALTQ